MVEVLLSQRVNARCVVVARASVAPDVAGSAFLADSVLAVGGVGFVPRGAE